MENKSKRVLWLLNHSSLRNFEVPLLIELGYEIFTPKSFPYTDVFMSGSVDYEYDKTLSIPLEALSILNSANFYGRLPQEVLDVMNRYFGTCISFFSIEQLREVIRGFHGIIILRAFGNPISYTETILEISGLTLFHELTAISNRLYFGQGYPHLATREKGVLRERALDLPIGMDNAEIDDQWRGEKNRIFVVYPQLQTNDHYAQQYEEFKRNFSGFDYIVGGAQAITSMDKEVTGYLEDADFRDAYINSKMMWYHSPSQYHIHYHPFEAVRHGLPLLFMAGSMLDLLGGKNLPGRCETFSEARKKAKRIMNGDKKFIKKIRDSQGVLIEKLSYAHCKPIWEESMRRIEELRTPSLPPKKKVAIVLNAEYTGGVLDYAVRLLDALDRGRIETKANVEFTFVHLAHPNFNDRNYFERVEDMQIPIRTFRYMEFSRRRVGEMLWLQYGKDFPLLALNHASFFLMDDGINYLNDFDFLIFASDRGFGTMAIQVPYIVCVHDYIQRYFNSYLHHMNLQDILNFTRKGEACLVTTPFTFDDCVQYANIPRRNVFQIPYLFDWVDKDIKMDSPNDTGEERPYFIWSTNASPHKNHKVVLEGISEYYQNGGQYQCYVTGVNTHLFLKGTTEEEKPNKYIDDIVDLIKADDTLQSNLVFCGNLPKKSYLTKLRDASFLLHGGIIDNGNGSVVDAAVLGVPSISSRYPAMEYMNDELHLNLHFFDPSKPSSLALQLAEAERSSEEWQNAVPTREQLSSHMLDAIYMDVFQTIRQIIHF